MSKKTTKILRIKTGALFTSRQTTAQFEMPFNKGLKFPPPRACNFGGDVPLEPADTAIPARGWLVPLPHRANPGTSRSAASVNCGNAGVDPMAPIPEALQAATIFH